MAVKNLFREFTSTLYALAGIVLQKMYILGEIYEQRCFWWFDVSTMCSYWLDASLAVQNRDPESATTPL